MRIPIAFRKATPADKSDHGNRFRKSLLIPGILPIVELRSSGNVPEHVDYRRYRGRNHFVRIFGKLKR